MRRAAFVAFQVYSLTFEFNSYTLDCLVVIKLTFYRKESENTHSLVENMPTCQLDLNITSFAFLIPIFSKLKDFDLLLEYIFLIDK